MIRTRNEATTSFARKSDSFHFLRDLLLGVALKNTSIAAQTLRSRRFFLGLSTKPLRSISESDSPFLSNKKNL